MYVLRGPRAPVPYKLMTKIKYSSSIQLAPTTIVTDVVHIFQANGTYDPDITGGGHQPRGFDQLMALYDHNVVVFSEITVMYPCSAVDSAPYIAHLSLEDFTSQSADLNAYLEKSDCVYKQVSGTQGYPTTLTLKRNPNTFLGRKDPLSDPNLKNSASANATEGAFWHVGLAIGSGTTPNSMRCHATITYTVVFIEPKDPGQS